MTRNKFAGQPCAYGCGRPSVGDDHVLARKFFVEDKRGNLPQVPACGECNGEKGALEGELMNVLAFAGRHADATENLSRQVAHRLMNKANARVARKLAAGRGRTWVKENGVLRQAMTVNVNWSKVELLCCFIARGLVWHYFDNLVLDAGCSVIAFSAIKGDADLLRRFRTGKAARRARGDVGQGTFSYWGVQAEDNPIVTAWEFSILGVRTVDGGDEPHNIGVLTGPREIAHRGVQKRELLKRWRKGTRLHG